MTSQKDQILFEIKDDIAIITLNRPKQKNALTAYMFSELVKIFKLLQTKDDICCCIFTANGDSFTAGVDLKEPIFADPVYIEQEFNSEHNIFIQMRACKFPILCALPGLAITGGLELALNCDFRIGTEKVFFKDTHSAFGIAPSGGLTVLLPRYIGLANAKYFSLTGHRMYAKEALEKGLLNEIVPQDKLLERAMEIAEILRNNNQHIMKHVLRNYKVESGMQLDEACNYEIQKAKQEHLNMAKDGKETTEKLNASLNSVKSKL